MDRVRALAGARAQGFCQRTARLAISGNKHYSTVWPSTSAHVFAQGHTHPRGRFSSARFTHNYPGFHRQPGLDCASSVRGPLTPTAEITTIGLPGLAGPH